MKTVAAALLFTAALVLGSAPTFAEGEAKQDIKDRAHAVVTAAKVPPAPSAMAPGMRPARLGTKRRNEG